MTNPLLAERQDSTRGYTGIGIAESAVDIYNGVQNGSWVEGGLGVLGTGLEMLSLALDPIGTLGQYAVSWLIEQIRPLREALNWLAGDADQIAAYAATWNNVSRSVADTGQQLRTEVETGTSAWHGRAADAYRANTGQQGEHITAAATAAATIGTVTEAVGMLVGAIRGIVRDLVAECISTLLIRIPQWLAELGLTLGFATPHVVSAAAALIAKWVGRISDVITKLVRSLEKLRPIMARLGEIWEAIKNGLRQLRTRPHGPDAPHTPDPVRMSDVDAPTPTTPSATTPSSTGVDTPGTTGTPTTPGSTTPTGTTGSPTTPTGTTGTPTTPGSTTPTGTTGTDVPPARTDPTPTDPTPVPPPRDYDATGRTIPTNQLQHPHADLLDQNLLRDAANNPNRVSDALSPGVPKDHPAVQDMIPGSYDPHGGLGQDSWNAQYWPTGRTDARGNPELVWPDPQAHPQGFSSPESRTPTVMTPGQQFDRFGPGFGQFGSPVGTPFPDRALPPGSLDAGYHRYEVVRPIPVWEGSIAPAMGQPGGGVQYYLPTSIVDLVNAGYLKEIPL
ncbi:MAG TPA: glycohydrolase toxin TNT-related protein [Actinophytocola sp.]|uniref:glycohydrolase toxin TNT-related protein n=1 Tax=Actinophytocola sp. TaxID=1872138 RepID=UPI002DBC0485|nr:glycohydrolase toxin TNT-related protein [Actinophytocola sp.]HEU5474959.1 glycohydrolase toxin TNT-related protein [Actinophytocola sp.]